MALDLTHSFINIFIGGRSDIKVLFFIAYLLVLAFLYLVFKKKTFRKFSWLIPAISLSLMYIYGLLLQFAFTLVNRIFVVKPFILGSNGELSSSRLWHSHIAKGIIGQIFYLFNRTDLPNMDAGGAYVGFFPTWFFLLGAIILMVLIFLAVWYFISSFKIYLEDKNIRPKIFLIIGYAIASFSLIEASIDGGIFVRGCLISVLFVFLLNWRARGKKISIYYYLVSSVICFIIIYVGLHISSLSSIDGLDVASGGALLLLYNIIIYGSEKKIRWPIFTAIVIIFLAGWWFCSIRDRIIYDYSKMSLAPNQLVYYYDTLNKETASFKLSERKTVGQISQELNKNISYMPVMAPGVNCRLNGSGIKIYTTIITPEPIEREINLSSSFIDITHYISMSDGNNWRTRLLISVKPCAPEIVSSLKGLLEKNNINRYILIDMLFK